MSAPEILNTSRYDTDDVMAIILAYGQEKAASWKTIKIRHMIKPVIGRRYINGKTESYEHWAKLLTVRRGDYDLEVCLLHPDKLGKNVLDRIALHDDEQANAKICEDLARVVDFTARHMGYSLVKTDLKIKLTKENDNAKSLNAYRNLTKRVERGAARLKSDRALLAKFWAEIKLLENSIPAQEKNVKLLKERLADQDRDLRKKGLL